MSEGYQLGRHFVQLTEGDLCLPVAVGPDFWEKGIADLPPGRLVSMFESATDWTSWERHPHGDELIIQMSGTIMLILDEAPERRITLHAGDFAIVPAGVWHTADVIAPGKAIFITPGEGTEGRPRG